MGVACEGRGEEQKWEGHVKGVEGHNGEIGGVGESLPPS